ncbi:MAG: type II CRISPR RNA-guided endonuclease Cas9 [Candidatus Cloacimonetes bacterium]|nr:type II CRISPR RNA-guided endonuclease Cas9 [Candidatus Cloacimonadota bacterium]
MGKKVLGLDIGVTSVGWAIIDVDENEIVDKGVRIFPERSAQDNIKRREKRGSRRSKRRRQQRLIDMKELLKEHGIIDGEFILLKDPYEIRCKGLEERLTNEELATAILHISKRRGSSFDNIDDIDEEDEKNDSNIDKPIAEDKITELKSTKKILDYNEKMLINKDTNYICLIQRKRLEESGSVRGSLNNFKTSEYVKEITKILSNQVLAQEFKEKVIDLIKRKRAYFEGPGSEKSPTPYGRWYYEKGEIKYIDLIERMRGNCSLFPLEKRAPKDSYTACLFNILNDLNNLKINQEKITQEQKEQIIELMKKEKGDFTIKKLCKFLDVEETFISGFRQDKSNKNLISQFTGYKKIRNVVINKELNKLVYENEEYVDKIIEILAVKRGIDERKIELKKIDKTIFSEEVADALAHISGCKEYHSLSFKAMRTMIPDLLATTDNQMQLITKYGIQKENLNIYKEKNDIMLDQKAVISPVALRAQNEAIKIINTIRRIYGELDTIVIEMARDKNSADEKKRINESQKRGEELNKQALELAEGKPLTGSLALKLRLYKEQDHRCIYSGREIDKDLLINDPFAYEIDHIIPISISLDDSFNNKVLTTSSVNNDKSNMTPFKFFSSGKIQETNFNEFASRVINLEKRGLISKNKLRNLLFAEDIDKQSVRAEFINRNLVDTRYATKVILNTLSNYFHANGIETKVHTINGKITDNIRNRAGLKKCRDYFYHHIVDAIIVAAVKKHKYFSKLLDLYETSDGIIYDDETGEVITSENQKDFFDDKLFSFLSRIKNINDLTNYNENIKISHKIDKKFNRQFTDETIYSTRLVDGVDHLVARYKDIYSNEGIKLAQMIKDGKDDAILMKKHDPESFALIKKIILETSYTDKENPFAIYKEQHGEIRKKAKDGKGPIIKSVKYLKEKLGNHRSITHKYQSVKSDKKIVLLQISPYRTDFYKSPVGLYKFVTVRYIDVSLHEKNGIIDMNEYEKLKQDKKIDGSYKFCFSVHHNEYIKITKKDEEPHIYRFVGTNNDKKNTIEVKELFCNVLKEKKQIIIVIGKKICLLEKFSCDILGNIKKIESEVLKLKN